MGSTVGAEGLTIPIINATVSSAKRYVTVDDVARLRTIETLRVSPDGSLYAVFVRQGDPKSNGFLTGWFVGSTAGGALVKVGDGGEPRRSILSSGNKGGLAYGDNDCLWSADGKWIVYRLLRGGEVQLWRSKADGTRQEQITNNAADVRRFTWSEDGESLYFTTGMSRADRLDSARDRARRGYRYDEDMGAFSDAIQSGAGLVPRDDDSQVWQVVLADRLEHRAEASEKQSFQGYVVSGQRAAGEPSGQGLQGGTEGAAKAKFVFHRNGGVAWIERDNGPNHAWRIMTKLARQGVKSKRCAAELCAGKIQNVWWNERGNQVLFARIEGLVGSVLGVYAWEPSTDRITTILRNEDDMLRGCESAAEGRLICIRETPINPAHVAAIDAKAPSRVEVLADVNPEFRNIRLGKVRRFEWDTPQFQWNQPGAPLDGLYEKRAYGYVLYPPNFKPGLKYPVFIQPYAAIGFDCSVWAEHALHVYAANGIVVLNLSFPDIVKEELLRGREEMKIAYSAELDFPHLSMYAESTLRGLDSAAAYVGIDQSRVGIGGFSHGSFVPLYILQHHDRIAAISISNGNWGPFMYYWNTAKGRDRFAEAWIPWLPRPGENSTEFYKRLDIADNVSEVEAPVLMNLADNEVFSLLRFIRHLSDARMPYDAYVYPDEAHQKWQPAHLYSIMNRNLDWFRYWLQDYVDPIPDKTVQYQKWSALRQLQCGNKRSLRDLCDHVPESHGQSFDHE